MKTRIYILIATCAMLLSSCSGQLDQFSHSSIPPGAITEKDLPALRVGMYREMQSAGTEEGFIMLDLLGGDLRRQVGSPLDLVKGFMSPLSGEVSGQWNGFYGALYQVNNVLEITADFPATSLKSQTQAEAHYFRAYLYYNLVIRWGDVPIFTETSQEKRARNSKAEVWALIEKDLAAAVSGLPERGKNVYYLSRDAARALQARVALAQGKMPEAAKYAESLINNGKYSLDAYEKIFRKEANNELIFAFENRNEESSILISDLFYTYAHANKGQGKYRPTQEFIDLFADNDNRKAMTLVDVAGSTCINKYPSGQTGPDPSIICRLAEMYLISAEAQGLNGIDRLNELRNYRGLASINPSSNVAMMDAILVERRRELAAENFRYFDLVRTGRAESEIGMQAYQTLFPIPGKELQLNDLLVKNPGY